MARSESYTVAAPLPLEDGAGDLTHAADLFNAADLLRGAVSPSDYKYIVLGLIFLKYVSDAFTKRRAWLEQAVREERSDYYVPGAGEDARRVGIDQSGGGGEERASQCGRVSTCWS